MYKGEARLYEATGATCRAPTVEIAALIVVLYVRAELREATAQELL